MIITIMTMSNRLVSLWVQEEIPADCEEATTVDVKTTPDRREDV